MPQRALLASILFATCCGLISIENGLSYICFKWVHKDYWYLVPQSALHYPWSSLSWQSGLFRLTDHIRWFLAGLICLMKCNLGGIFGFTYRSIVFGAWEHLWSLWLLGSLYVGLDYLIWPTFVHGHGHDKGHPKVCHRIFFEWCISQHVE